MIYRLAADCPACGAAIVVRENRRNRTTFIACSAYPECRWTAPYDEAIQSIAAQLAEARAKTRAGGVDVKRELRAIITVAHPDRWPSAQELVHEVTVLLSTLRDKL